MAQQLPKQFGRYTIIQRLGQGGMGSVYLAEDGQLGRRVALKVPDFGPDGSGEARQRFLDEARTAATLDHPYLCRIFDVGESDGRLYLTMAYIEGQSLAALIGAEDWTQRQVAVLVGKLAQAMQKAHAQKVIHRDLKPANVMIKTTGPRREPVIVDFGLALRVNPGVQRLTKSGQIMGTLSYMAPEQLRGDMKEIGPACDIYALGVILYELLTGRLPFSGSGLAVAGQILTTTPLPPSTHRGEIDPALESICLRAMAKEPKDRYPSMAELVRVLSEHYKPRPTTTTDSGARPAPALEPATQKVGPAAAVPQSNRLREDVRDEIVVEPETPLAPKASASSRDETGPEPPSGGRPRVPRVVLGAGFGGLVALGVIISMTTGKGHTRIDRGDSGGKVQFGAEQHGKKVDEKSYGQSPRADPTGPLQGSSRTERGGSWLHDPWFARSAYRGENPPTVRYSSLGFRVARNQFGRSGTDGSTGRAVDRFAPTLVVKPPAPIPAQPTGGVAALPHSGSITNSLGMKLVLIPAGEFMMGVTPDAVQNLRSLAEAENWVKFFDQQFLAAPPHRVTLTKPWFMGATEVTIGHFRKFVEATKYVTEADQYGFGDSPETKIDAKISAEQKKRNWRTPGYRVTDDSPVTEVTWNDAATFCNWLSTQEKLKPCYQKEADNDWSLLSTGEGYRLPTEAEWEYACQAGSTNEPTPVDGFAWLKDHAWYSGNHPGGPQSVAMKPSNAFGLYDMRGNVFEWCHDKYGHDSYLGPPPDDPTLPAVVAQHLVRHNDSFLGSHDPQGPSSGDQRVQRGGAWSYPAINCHSGFRTYAPQSSRIDHRGFRVVRVSTKAP